MKNYVYTYHTTQTTPPSSEGMAAWNAWMDTLSDHLVDGGNPITRTKAILKDGKTEPCDDDVVGYSIIKANDLDEAVAFAKDCPLAQVANGEVRVYETGQM
jgi:hypothetical protein